MVRAITVLLMGWAMEWATVRATTVILMEWAVVRATTILMGWATRATTCTNPSPVWAWASERAQLWAMLWALERNMTDIVAMQWALRAAPLTRNNTVRETVTAVAAIAATAAMTSVIAKLITTGFHV
ncbi:uncharacterized protein [Solanum lycopersicum]|uniref:uncharacterized protein n=1 Tax=Solanum lycopersicum TaxID=4081 RepID=UPI000532B229|nr:uncharacterized protein LOC101259182 [Solanum lycopersicum]